MTKPSIKHMADRTRLTEGFLSQYYDNKYKNLNKSTINAIATVEMDFYNIQGLKYALEQKNIELAEVQNELSEKQTAYEVSNKCRMDLLLERKWWRYKTYLVLVFLLIAIIL